jgi:uncharacterized protein
MGMTKAAQLLAVAAVASALLLAGAGDARADVALCASHPPPSSDAQALRRAPIAFEGVAVGGRRVRGADGHLSMVSPLTFRVTQWIKGDRPNGGDVRVWDGRYARLPDHVLRAAAPRVARRFPGEIVAGPGQAWRVYATEENGVVFTCTNLLGSHPLTPPRTANEQRTDATRRPLTLFLVGLAVALAGLLQALSGFGFSLVAVPIVSVLAGAKVAVVAATALSPLITLSLAATGRRQVRWRVVAVVAGSSIVGMPIGLWVLTHVSERVLALAIGAVVIVLTLVLISGRTASGRPGMDVGAGFASGVLATSTGTNGPPVVLALQARRVPPGEFRATLAATFMLQGLVALLGFALAGRLTAGVGRVVLVGLPGLVVGRLLGDRLFARLDPRRFRGLVLALLLATGAFALLDALSR